MLCVRKAEISEIPAVMQFIAEHWKKDHILAVDRDCQKKRQQRLL